MLSRLVEQLERDYETERKARQNAEALADKLRSRLDFNEWRDIVWLADNYNVCSLTLRTHIHSGLCPMVPTTESQALARIKPGTDKGQRPKYQIREYYVRECFKIKNEC